MVQKLKIKSKSSVTMQRRELYSGPIPHPEQLEWYENITPGASDRIITMAEQEQKNRHVTEKENLFLIKLGLIFAFIIVTSAILGGLYLVINDKSIQGFSLIFTGLAPIIALFIYKRNNGKE